MDEQDQFPFDQPPPADEQIKSAAAPPEPGYTRKRSMLRLLVGGLLNGYDELTDRLQAWEAEPDKPEGTQAAEENESGESEAELRLALIGLLFTSQERLQRRFRVIRERREKHARRLAKLMRPMFENSMLDKLAERGEKELQGLIETGRKEALHSRRMARAARDEMAEKQEG